MRYDRVRTFSHIGLLGAGAVGSLFGALLSRCARVTLVCRQAHADAVNDQGLNVCGHRTLLCRLRATPDASALADVDAVVLTAKSFDTRGALELARPHLRAGTPVLVMQNGLRNEEVARETVPECPVFRGVTYTGVRVLGPGRIEWAAPGPTVVGNPFGLDADTLNRFAEALRRAELDCTVVEDIRREVWRKTIGNVAINPLGAILRLTNGQLVESPSATALMKSLVQEAEAVARARGYDLDTLEEVVALARATAANRNSMLQDIEANRPTEIDCLNGAVVQWGRQFGVPVPVNTTVTRLVKTLEQQSGQRRTPSGDAGVCAHA